MWRRKCKAIGSLFSSAAKARSAAFCSKSSSSPADDATLKHIVSSPDADIPSFEFLKKSPNTSISETDDLGEKEQLIQSFDSMFSSLGDKEQENLSVRKKAFPRERKRKVVCKNTDGGPLRFTETCSENIVGSLLRFAAETSSAVAYSKPPSFEFVKKSPETSISKLDDLGEKEQLIQSFDSMFTGLGDKERENLSVRKKAYPRERKHKITEATPLRFTETRSEKIGTESSTIQEPSNFGAFVYRSMERETSVNEYNALRVAEMLKNLR